MALLATVGMYALKSVSHFQDKTLNVPSCQMIARRTTNRRTEGGEP